MAMEMAAGQPLEVRWDKDDPRTFEARICNYGVVDSKGTSWAPGVFTRSLESGLPKAVWSHDWQRPIGQVTGYTDSAEGLDVTVQLADFDAVPDARMAHSLLSDGIIDNFSFGFYRDKDEPDPQHRGAKLVTQATIKEVSPVLVGSVPGTRTLAVRSEETETQVDPTETRTAVESAMELYSEGRTEEAAGLLMLIADALLLDDPTAFRSVEPTEEQVAEQAEIEQRTAVDLVRLESMLDGRRPF